MPELIVHQNLRLTALPKVYIFNLDHNVRVSLVCPGFIKTPMTDQNDFPMPMIKSLNMLLKKYMTE